jgi:hypothetical protein
MVKQGTVKNNTHEMTTASFMGQMNRLAQANPPQEKKQEINILAYNNRQKR